MTKTATLPVDHAPAMLHPSTRRGVGRPPRYPWREMQVGDTFLVTNPPDGGIRGSRTHASKATGFRFTIRTVADGLRVWRTA